MRKVQGVVAAVAVTGLCAIFSAHAADIVQSDLRPCLHDGTTIGGVNSCGKVWKLKSGQARLSAAGEVHVEVAGHSATQEQSPMVSAAAAASAAAVRTWFHAVQVVR